MVYCKGPKSLTWNSKYCISEIIIKTYFRQDNPARASQQLSKLLHSDVKNLTSILVCRNGPKSATWNSKHCICEIITWDLFFIPLFENHLRTIIQQIDLLYNDVKNLTSILSCRNVTKLYFQRNIEKLYFYLKSSFNTPLLRHHLLANNNLINFLYIWGEELNFYLDLVRRTQVSVFKNRFLTFVSVR